MPGWISLKPMLAIPWSLLGRRAATALAVLALLQALLPGWHQLDHVDLVVSHVGHACDHPHVGDQPDDGHGDDRDHEDCPLCLSLQAGTHAAHLTPDALVLVPAPPAERIASREATGIHCSAARWTPPARGPPRRA